MKVLGKLILIIIYFLLFVSCKNTSNQNEKSVLIDKKTNLKPHKNQSEQPNCITKADRDKIKNYLDDFYDVIINKNKDKYIEYINFPLIVDNNTFISKKDFTKKLNSKDKDSFVSGVIYSIENYISNKTINSDELKDMKKSEPLISDCLYKISKVFPQNEFAFFFDLQKINNKIKLVKVRIAG